MLFYSRLPSIHLTPRPTLEKVLKDLRKLEEMESRARLGLVSEEKLDQYKKHLAIGV